MAISYPEMEVEALYDENYDEAAGGEPWEATRGRSGRGGRPVTTARGSNAYQRPVSNSPVDQKQFQEALTKVAAEMTKNADGLKQLNERVTSLGAEQARQMAILRKENADRKKQSDALGNAVRQLRDAEEIIPLLSGRGVTGLQGLLPIVLLSGIQVPPSDAGAPAPQSGGLFAGGGDNSMLMLALLAGNLGTTTTTK
jgi:hypothetical protein